MKKRLLILPPKKSLFVFGARNTGKSTLIKQTFSKIQHFYIDLLDLHQERIYLRDPQRLKAEVLALPKATKYVVIDEVQKIPDLLSVVHALIEETKKFFILTGSSARKLKYGHADMLAGRAIVRNLFPFSFLELGQTFSLDKALQFGMLPKIYDLKTTEDKAEFLRTYTHVYLKEEVWSEHLIRKLEPFQYFLEVAAQASGHIINVSNIARDVGVNDKSIAQYFSILEDTLIGFYLPAFHYFFRKRLAQKPKFYFFDIGVARALCRTVSLPLIKQTYDYGNYFEQFIVLECLKLSSYFSPDYRFSYFKTRDDVEIDLVVERPGKPLLMIEIKSSEEVRSEQLKHLAVAEKEFGPKAEYVCFAQVPRALKLGQVYVYPWAEGIQKYFLPRAFHFKAEDI